MNKSREAHVGGIGKQDVFGLNVAMDLRMRLRRKRHDVLGVQIRYSLQHLLDDAAGVHLGVHALFHNALEQFAAIGPRMNSTVRAHLSMVTMISWSLS